MSPTSSPTVISLKSGEGLPGIHIDLGALEAPMKDALLRTSVFLGYAVRLTEGAPLASAALDAPIHLSVGVPDPIPEEARGYYQREFKTWAIGQGLMEIDQAYNRYLEVALNTKADIRKFQIARELLPHKKRYENSWNLHVEFYADAGQKSPNHDQEARFLRSLGNARNCLAHDSGVVSANRLIEHDKMPVRWMGRDMVQAQPDGSKRIIPQDRPFIIQTGDVGLPVSVEDVVRERLYAEGERVEFSPTDLGEIIFLYQILAMQVGGEMHRFVNEAIQSLNTHLGSHREAGSATAAG